MVDGVDRNYERIACYTKEGVQDATRADGKIEGHTKFTLNPVLVHVPDYMKGWVS